MSVEPGALVSGWRVGELLHRGGNANVFDVSAEAVEDPGFAVVMKVPPLGPGEAALGILSFEVEQMILPTLTGPHVPRFVATGDAQSTPYLVMERIAGRSLAELGPAFPLSIDEAARIGARIADAVHSLRTRSASSTSI